MILPYIIQGGREKSAGRVYSDEIIRTNLKGPGLSEPVRQSKYIASKSGTYSRKNLQSFSIFNFFSFCFEESYQYC